MWRLRTIAGGLAVCALLVAPALADVGAISGSHHYCGYPNYVYPNTGCYSGSAHTYDLNSATYNGSGSFFFCESLGVAADPMKYSYKCRNTPGSVQGFSDDNHNAPYFNSTVYMRDIVWNYDNNRHTIDGLSSW